MFANYIFLACILLYISLLAAHFLSNVSALVYRNRLLQAAFEGGMKRKFIDLHLFTTGEDRLQKTLAAKVSFHGKGVHSGKLTSVQILPADSDTGILFQRTDIANADYISAIATNITTTHMSTVLGNQHYTIATIEHLMAALFGVGIDNAVIKVNGPEIPILDGSSRRFSEKFEKIGYTKLSKPKTYLAVTKEFEVRSGDGYIRILPAAHLSFLCTIDFGDKVIGRQSLDMPFTKRHFLEIAEARTFCRQKDIHALQSQGKALGGSLDNAVVVNDSGVVNQEGLRMKDEFVRHKLLDGIGDLALLGAPLIGRVEMYKPGHTLNAQFTKIALEKKDELFKEVQFKRTTHIDLNKKYEWQSAIVPVALRG